MSFALSMSPAALQTPTRLSHVALHATHAHTPNLTLPTWSNPHLFSDFLHSFSAAANLPLIVQRASNSEQWTNGAWATLTLPRQASARARQAPYWGMSCTNKPTRIQWRQVSGSFSLHQWTEHSRNTHTCGWMSVCMLWLPSGPRGFDSIGVCCHYKVRL